MRLQISKELLSIVLIAIITLPFVMPTAAAPNAILSGRSFSGQPNQVDPPSSYRSPPLSEVGYQSFFAKVNGLGFVDLSSPFLDAPRLIGQPKQAPPPDLSVMHDCYLPIGGCGTVYQVTKDWNGRPQDDPTIAVSQKNSTTTDPSDWVVSANDYGIGVPVGTGTYGSLSTGMTQVNYFPPFPVLPYTPVGVNGNFTAPAGTGDPALVSGTTRLFQPAVPGGHRVVYSTSIGFSSSSCVNGVFVYASFSDGLSWTRPEVLYPGGGTNPQGGTFGFDTVAYWPRASDCRVFSDRPWIAIDNYQTLPGGSPNPHFGRIYITWTEFEFENGIYYASPIFLSYSDYDGFYWSAPIVISGSSQAYCRTQITPHQANSYPCDEDQWSVPVVAADGGVYVGFENDQYNGVQDGFRNQYLVVRVDPNTFAVSGPFKVDPGTYAGSNGFPSDGTMADGEYDYPINTDGRPTLCNANFRVTSAGNLAYGGRAPGGQDVLYVVWSDDRAEAGSFYPGNIMVDQAAPHVCPYVRGRGIDRLRTDSGIFISESLDGGVTWAPGLSAQVNKFDSRSNDRWSPWLAVALCQLPCGDTLPPCVSYDYRATCGALQALVFYDRQLDPDNTLVRATVELNEAGGYPFNGIPIDASGFSSDFSLAFFGTGRFIGDNTNVIFSCINSLTPSLSIASCVSAVFTGQHNYAVSDGTLFPNTDTDIYLWQSPAIPLP